MNQIIAQDKKEVAHRLLDELVKQGVSLNVDQGKLRVLTRQGALNARNLAQLKSCKEEIIALLNAQKDSRTIVLNPGNRGRNEPFPLTDIQRAYWVGHQDAFDLGSVSIHFYAEVQSEPIDIHRLNVAINKLIARHDMLHAVVDGEGNQRILSDVPQYAVELVNCLGMSNAECQDLLHQLREKKSHSHRDSAIWPGFSFTLVKLSEHQDLLLFSVDLLHVDGGSLLILFDELYQFYSDETFSPEPLVISYR
ncbi:MAG: amino acid adenylation protein, partial [Cellvibrio sp.]|nr:amino acid adenylation protein [Cellvibrio sp.]